MAYRVWPQPEFIIGVEQVPTRDIAKWRALGANTFVRWGAGENPAEWVAECNRHGAFQIREPFGNPAADADNNLLLSYVLPDESDLNGITADKLKDIRATTAITTTVRPGGVPYLGVFSGGLVLDLVKPPVGIPTPDYAALTAQCDIIGSDIYPVCAWGLQGAVDLFSPMRCVQKLKTFAPGKRQLAYIETCDQLLPWPPQPTRCQTPEEFDVQMAGAIYAGIAGVVFFPLRPMKNTFMWDATPANLQSRIVALSQRFR